MTDTSFDIVVVGAGIVGMTAALALAQRTSLKIAILDAKYFCSAWDGGQLDARVSAISHASQTIFSHLNVWQSMRAKRVSPYTHMHVWDANSTGVIDFDCADVSASTLGHIVEDSVMRSSLVEKLEHCSNVALLSNVTLQALIETPDAVQLQTSDNSVLQARLVIGADGANSWVRDQVGIELKTWQYAHTAIVTTVRTALPHQKIALQRFLPTGPLAFLPLSDTQTCSIVWSAVPEYADKLMSFQDDVFRDVLGEAISHQLGDILSIDKRYAFPLQMRHAKQYVRPHLALMGDAAHTIHPLAGQGVNMGLLDAASLVDVVQGAMAKGRDFSSLSVLRRYERWRKSDNVTFLAGVELIKQLFGSENTSVRSLRSAGLNLTNRLTVVKNYFAQYALGRRSDMPRLALPRYLS